MFNWNSTGPCFSHYTYVYKTKRNIECEFRFSFGRVRIPTYIECLSHSSHHQHLFAQRKLIRLIFYSFVTSQNLCALVFDSLFGFQCTFVPLPPIKIRTYNKNVVIINDINEVARHREIYVNIHQFCTNGGANTARGHYAMQTRLFGIWNSSSTWEWINAIQMENDQVSTEFCAIILI